MQKNEAVISKIQHLVKVLFGNVNYEIKMLPPSGSYRQYYRIFMPDKTLIGVFNSDLKENKAYLSFSNAFGKMGLPVPKTLLANEQGDAYLLEDLGDETLINFINKSRYHKKDLDVSDIYKKVIEQLVRFQIDGAKVIDFNVCYPRKAFDAQSIKWDLYYFKYNFLKPAIIAFDEQLLEDDFEKLTSFLDETDKEFFMYRDFQSSNIMLANGEPYFIDFQGGRYGPLQYDIASLLFDAKARIGHAEKLELLAYYIAAFQKKINMGEAKFMSYFYPVALVRIMQAMGAYGFRGLIEKKTAFLQSIPLAINNLKFIIRQCKNLVDFPELFNVFHRIIEAKNLDFDIKKSEKLTINITSFSYKKGIPDDYSGNGGGFVFDCRGIYNPGRQKEFQQLTGQDGPVKIFLDNQPEMKRFLDNVESLVSITVNEYVNRGFSNLMVNFGCTGGQHRSVYAAEQLAAFLQNKYEVNIRVWHREQDIKYRVSHSD